MTTVGADIGAWLGLTIGGTVRAVEASGRTTTVTKRPALMAPFGPGTGGSGADFVLNPIVATAARNAPDMPPIRGASAAR
ncbi:MAG: hypothetical protein KGI51_03305 [Rhodospirillales bacterium]|nr:hypothetical protein [Rhodospirillales bacterium]